ncbi:MAG: terminase large subunit [Chelatococcus sp.]|nr:terminase large subunit [Chelatococcus sp. HY11]MBX3545896.1 terminase large subunit [Chelatococcus sp.]
MHAPPPEPDWLAAARTKPQLAFAALGWDRAKAVEGAWYDHALAERVIEIWPTFFRHTEGRWAGKPFHLTPWQACVVRLLVGWKMADGFRLFQRMFLWVGRKNGKTEFMAALSLLFWLLDGEMGGQAYAMARDEKQAKLVFDKAKRMIALSPAFAKRVQQFKKSIYCPQLWAKFEVLSGNPEGKHGLSASVIVGDEMHEWRDDLLYNTLHQSIAARDQPIELLGSTAGFKGRGYGWTLWEESLAILEGRRNDPRSLVVIFAVPADADWSDESLWPLANPNLGISPKLEYLRDEAAKAADNPRLESNFRRYHLNQWVANESRWFPIHRWDACCLGPDSWRQREDNMRGRACYGGLDLSRTRDVTALFWWFPPEDGGSVWDILCRFWVPEDTLEERVRRDRVKYDLWHREGALLTTPGDWVDQNAIKAAIQEDASRFDVRGIGYDPWGATKLAQELLDEGAPMVEVRQGIPSLGEASVEFEKMVYAKTMDHGGHPVLRWMMENVVLHIDRNGNFKPDKGKSSEKIDGIVAGVTGLALAMRDVDTTSVYETRGILEIEI